MHDRIRAARNKESGFTLIELLIVIVILGILAGVVIFASGAFANKGKAESCATTRQAVKTAAEAFRVDSASAQYPVNWASIAPTYFDLNGITSSASGAVGDPTTISGKGWSFTWVSGYVAGPPIVNNPPTVGACVLT
jgi:general secretion pathway protein G